MVRVHEPTPLDVLLQGFVDEIGIGTILVHRQVPQPGVSGSFHVDIDTASGHRLLRSVRESMAQMFLQQPPQQPDDTATIRILNLPRLVEIDADGNALPRALTMQGRRLRVEAIQDVWRIDDEWWREPISRRYFLVTLEGGIVRTVFQDLLSGEWFVQSY